MHAELPPVHRRTPEEIKRIVASIEPPLVRNVVAAARDNTYEGRVNLHRLAWRCAGKQNKREFAAPCTMPIRLNNYTFTLNVFERRRFVITGAVNENLARLGMHASMDYIRAKAGYSFQPAYFRVTNIQATVYMRRPINIQRLSAALPSAFYEPETINRLTYTLRSCDVTFLVFPSGGIVMTGAKDRHQLMQAFELMIPFLAHFVAQEDVVPQEGDRLDELFRYVNEHANDDVERGLAA